MYRIFGSPYSLTTHQSAMYLRHKGVEFNMHVSSLLGTRFASWWHKCAATFAHTSPTGKTLLTFQDLVEDCERAHPTPMLMVTPEDHPSLRLVGDALLLYSMYWLMNTGGLFRWVQGEGSHMMGAHASYFIVTIAPVSKAMGNAIRGKMKETLAQYGITDDSEPFYCHHFFKLLNALEDHLTVHEYLLGTPHPTLADVTMAAVFECHFVQDDPPATDIREGAPAIMKWLDKMTLTSADGTKRPLPSAKGYVYPDRVSETLMPIVSLMLEVLPWLVAQCDAMKLWHGQLRTVENGPKLVTLPVVPNDEKKMAANTEIKGYSVGRILEQGWEMALEDVTVPCKVSVPHVHLAQWMAKDVATLSWSVGGRKVSSVPVASDAENVEPLVNLHGLIERMKINDFEIQPLPEVHVGELNFGVYVP